MRSRRPSGSRAREGYSGGYDHVTAAAGPASSLVSLFRSLVLVFMLLGAESQIVPKQADQAEDHRQVSNPFERGFPEPDRNRYFRIFGQPAVELGLACVVEDVNHPGAADTGWIVHPGLRKIEVLPKLLGPVLSQFFHVVFAAEVQTPSRASFDTGWLQPFAHSVRAKGAFEDALGLRVELGNVERATGQAIAAADAFILLKIDDSVGVLDDRAISRACGKASRLGAVHALVLAHQPHHRAVFALVFVELDQIPIVPPRVRHRLVGVVEDRFAERQVIPFHTSHLARFAADASGGVDQLADGVLALRALPGNGTRMP